MHVRRVTQGKVMSLLLWTNTVTDLDFDLDLDRDLERERREPSLERAGEGLPDLAEPGRLGLLEAERDSYTNHKHTSCQHWWRGGTLAYSVWSVEEKVS